MWDYRLTSQKKSVFPKENRRFNGTEFDAHFTRCILIYFGAISMIKWGSRCGENVRLCEAFPPALSAPQ